MGFEVYGAEPRRIMAVGEDGYVDEYLMVLKLV